MTIEIIIDGQPLSELPGRVDRVEQAQLDMAELVGSKVDLASQSAASAAQRAVDVSARVDDLEELVATLKQALDSSDTTPPVDPPVVDPPVVTPPKPQPPSGTARRLPAHLRGVFGIHGEQWPTYREQVAKLDPVLANRMMKYNFGTLNVRRARFDTAPEGWTTGDSLDLSRQQWKTNLFGYKLQLPVSQIKYTGAGKPNEAHVDVPVEAWRPAHPQHQLAKTWLTQLGRDIAARQKAGQLVDPLPVTILHENLGSYAFILGHTVNPKSAVEWKVTGATLPHSPLDYGMFFRFTADTLRDTGAKILAIYSPNGVRLDTQSLAEACVAAIGEDYLDAYGMSAYHHSANQMASAEGFDRIGVTPSAGQLAQSLEGNCQFIRELTDAPIMVNEFGFNPTREHRNDQGKQVVTNAAPVEHLIPDYFQTAARFDIGQLWYFNADKIGGKEAFDILDDGNGTQHKSGTARILVEEARKWSDKVRS